jgi:hypothetical protein
MVAEYGVNDVAGGDCQGQNSYVPVSDTPMARPPVSSLTPWGRVRVGAPTVH